MTPLIRTEVDDTNRLYWICTGESMESLKEPRHECPVLAIYGHCHSSKYCEACKRTD